MYPQAMQSLEVIVNKDDSNQIFCVVDPSFTSIKFNIVFISTATMKNNNKKNLLKYESKIIMQRNVVIFNFVNLYSSLCILVPKML